MKNIRGFYLKFFGFLEVKFSTYLHRCVFVMSSSKPRTAQHDAPFISCNDMVEKYCITFAHLQWLFHSGEQAVAHGPLVLAYHSGV